MIKHPFFGLLTISLALTLLSCSKSRDPYAVTTENRVTTPNHNISQSIGDETIQFTAQGTGTVEAAIRNHRMQPTQHWRDGEIEADSLLVGFPMSQLRKEFVFGASVTTVSDKTDPYLGLIRLSDLTPIHVWPTLNGEPENLVITLAGCIRFCSENSTKTDIVHIPVVAIDETNQLYVIDLSSLGSELNLIEITKNSHTAYSRLQHKSSATTQLDFTRSTLVFDITTKMIPKGMEPETAPETIFVSRWYLRGADTFDPNFVSRDATEGVGYFMGTRYLDEKIQRFSLEPTVNAEGLAPVKYYIKNVPAEHRASFSAAFDEWNALFTELTGGPIFRYEYLEPSDPRYSLVIAGDVRYNVLEWDIDNVTVYGGYGPSAANQITGEMIHANVLIQGPKIIEGYSQWFEAFERAADLRLAGRHVEAERLMADTVRALKKATTDQSPVEYQLKWGELTFTAPGDRHGLEDEASLRPKEFHDIPEGQTYETYMDGYFKEMVLHELGHNLGLRHNFHGNLGAKAELGPGGVSNSAMEYLSRPFRHLNHLGHYDRLAIDYGYAGNRPAQTDLFCTDGDVPTAYNQYKGSAECSRDDGTHDPFGYFQSELERAIGFFLGKKHTESPVWTNQDIRSSGAFTDILTGLSLYGSGRHYGDRPWKGFPREDRPTEDAEIQAYVLNVLKGPLCDNTYDAIVETKATPQAKQATQVNLEVIRERIRSVAAIAYQSNELNCSTE